jgi:hypothetical protein
MADTAANQGEQHDAALVIELATRLLSRFDPRDADGSTMQLLPGEVPAEVRETLPFPDSIRIVGSMVSPRAVTVILDAPLSKEQLQAFYDERLLGSGWNKPEPFDPFPRGGFSHSMMSMPWLQMQYYCRGPKEPYIILQTFEKASAPTDVRLSYVSDSRNSPCSARQRSRMQPFAQESIVIPALSPPPKSLQTPRGSQGSVQDYFAESIAYLKSNLDMEAIHAHYQTQLEKFGWQESESGGDETRAWTKYTFRDKEGQDWWGLLLATAFPTQWGEYLLYVLARFAEAEAQFDDFLTRSGMVGWSF